MSELALNSTWLMDYVADLAPPRDVGATPHGVRQIYNVTGGWFEGPRLKGKLHPDGADWLMIRPDGVAELDVRATLETDDGALLYVSYYGILRATPEIFASFGSNEPPQDDQFYFRTCPRVETGDARYQWLNEAVCVAIGNPEHLKIGKNQVAYRVFQIL